MTRPPISGLLPIFNGHDWVAKNLPIILESLGPLDELVVVDDGSTDETSQLILDFADSDSRITLHKLAHNGLVHSLNAGLKLARNPWVARYDIDDLYPSDRLTHQIALTQNNENVGVIFSDYNIWKNGECFRGRIPSPLFHLQSKISLVNSQRTAHPVALINREFAQLAGGYLENEFPAEDLGLWIRIAKVSQIITSEHVGLEYNRRSDSISNSMRELVLKKKSSLVKTIHFSNSEIHSLIHNFDELISSYDGYPLAEVRKYLFCYDYLTWLGITDDSNVLQMEKKIVKKLRQAQMSAILSFDTVRFGSQSFRRKFERLLER